MEDIMIRVNDVSMKFNLNIDQGFSVKQAIIELFSKKKREERKANLERNNFWALRDVNFEVKRGEVVGLVGTNGAGKSTLLKIVAGVYKPTTGGVQSYGTICPMIELGAGFDPELSATENVYLNGAIMGYSREFLESKFHEVVEFSELHEFMDVPTRNFSSGMMARLAFSVATIMDPEILIVDEILAVGDAKFRKKSEEKMLSMITGGTTVLYVSHSMDSIRRLCNRVLWLEKGKVIMYGETNEVCDAYMKKLGLLK